MKFKCLLTMIFVSKELKNEKRKQEIKDIQSLSVLKISIKGSKNFNLKFKKNQLIKRFIVR